MSLLEVFEVVPELLELLGCQALFWGLGHISYDEKGLLVTRANAERLSVRLFEGIEHFSVL